MNPEAIRIPNLKSAQVAEVDRVAAARFGLPVEWLMEAAGWQIARRCRGRTVRHKCRCCGAGAAGVSVALQE